MAQPASIIMKTYNKLYKEIISFENLILAWKKARKGKTKKEYVVKFEEELFCNLMALHYELKYKSYKPRELVTFVLRDPKTRVISKSDFRDRIVHHAVCNILEPIFDKSFIYDSCANRLGKGNLFGLKRLKCFIRKVSKNGLVAKNRFQDKNYIVGYCLKADIRHYFEEVDHEILINLLSRKVTNKDVIWLIRQILKNNSVSSGGGERLQGMPLGNLTSQFFANVYLNELDYFVKHNLKAKYYIRYVDDFVILHNSKEQLEIWKRNIDKFLRGKLKIELHPQKSRIIPLSRGIDFVGFRNFYCYRLVRKRNIRKMLIKLDFLRSRELSYWELMESYQGWQAYVKWANSFHLRKKILKEVQSIRKALKTKVPSQIQSPPT
jgi:RNA-directed DNA polymerase